MNINTKALLAAALASTLAGCATYDPYGAPSYPGYSNPGYPTASYPADNYAAQAGVITSVRTVALGRDSGIGAGAVVGAIIGGVAARELVGDNNRGLATVAGAAAGGYIGDRIQDSRTRTGQEITVRLDSGQTVVVVQEGSSLYAGRRVLVTGYGANARVVAR